MCRRSIATYSPVLASIPSSPEEGMSGFSFPLLQTESAASFFSLYHAQEHQKVAALERRLWISTR